jgi:tRNA threonylcarbamoyladenosine biosynthesis protein TsaB
VLVIDTALGACTAAVIEDGRVLGLRSEEMAKGHQERLGGFVRDAVGDGFAAIDRVGVTVGPGSVTGLRVGLAFAQGLGSALDRAVVGLSTLHGLAASAPPDGLTVAAIDARRGQVYLQLFRDGVPLDGPVALAVDAAAERIAAAGAPDRLVGSGASLLAGRSPSAAVLDMVAPEPVALARLTLAAPEPAAFPAPIYLRAPDATPPTRLPGQPRS